MVFIAIFIFILLFYFFARIFCSCFSSPPPPCHHYHRSHVAPGDYNGKVTREEFVAGFIPFAIQLFGQHASAFRNLLHCAFIFFSLLSIPSLLVLSFLFSLTRMSILRCFNYLSVISLLSLRALYQTKQHLLFLKKQTG